MTQRSQTSSMPLPEVSANGNRMYRWLGNFWTALFEDAALAKRAQEANGLLSAQLYLNCLETLNLLNHNKAPVFHRERWHAITLDERQRNTGKALAVKLSGSNPPVIGPQTEAPYAVDRLLEIGGYAALTGVTSYPLPDATLVGTAGVLVDDIVNPQHVLLRDVDFRIENETILFYNNNDPFTLGFPTQRVLTGNGDEHVQVVLWLSDALFDRNYVFNYMGAIFNIRDASSPFYAAYLSALWDLYASGASIALFRAGVAALLDEPAILEDAERVETILTTPGRDTQVITDKHVYDISSLASLHSTIRVGVTLTRGTLLTDTVRIYDNLDPTRLTADGNDAATFRLDTNVLFLPPGFFRAQIKRGLGITLQMQDLIYAGADANGNPKLRFTLYGAEDDVEAYWADFWNYCQQRGISSQTCFETHLRGTLIAKEGAVWGQLSPVEYFLANFLKAQAVVIAVDSARLSAAGRSALHLLTALKPALPAHICLFVVERQELTPEIYDMGAELGDARVPAWVTPLNEIAGPSEFVKTRLTYGQAQPVVRWIPTCKGERV